MRVAQEEPLRRAQPGLGERRGDQLRLAAALGSAGDPPVQPDALGHRLVDGLPRVERAGGVLQHHLHLGCGAPAAPGASSPAARPRTRTSPAVGRCSPTASGPAWSCPSRTPRPARGSRPRPTARSTPSRARGDGAAAGGELARRRRAPRAAARRRAVITAHPTRMQAAGRPPPTSSSGGSAVAAGVDRPAGSAARTSTPAAGRAGRAGRRPARPARSAPPGRRSAGRRRDSALGVGVAAGRRRPRSAEPISTTRPAYITATRSQTSASTDRSWLMISRPTPRSLHQAGEQVEDLRLHHHVERGGRLVGDDQLRAGRPAPSRSSPAAAARPRAGAGRPGTRAARQPDLLEQLADPRGDLAPRRARARAAGSARRSGSRPGAPG